MHNYFRKIYWVLSAQFGVDPIKFVKSMIGLLPFVRDFILFRKMYKGKLEIVPCLHDRHEEGGEAKGEYFWQDLHVARKIYSAAPRKHVDIASRVDGFVAHVASFREIEVFDIRPISAHIPGVIFKQADLMNLTSDIEGYCDSLSCLHALEHFGLGRYGDQLDSKGHEIGVRNMARILRQGGIFYLSVPVGIERVEFNANRIFEPNSVIDIAANNGLALRELFLYSNGKLAEISPTTEALSSIGQMRYGLGIFVFEKL